MPKLFCAIVEYGAVLSVDFGHSDIVADLKDKIKQQSPNRIHFDAALLNLYLAKRGGSWLNICSNDVKAVKRGKTLETIKELMKEPMEEARNVTDRANLGPQFARKDGEIHILVELPPEPDQVGYYRGLIDALLVGLCVVAVVAVVAFAVAVYYPWDQEACLANSLPHFVCDCADICIGIVFAMLVGLGKLLICWVESKIASAYRHAGYECIA